MTLYTPKASPPSDPNACGKPGKGSLKGSLRGSLRGSLPSDPTPYSVTQPLVTRNVSTSRTSHIGAFVCHARTGTEDESQTQSDGSSAETKESAGSANTPAPTAATTSSPSPHTPPSSGSARTGKQHTSTEQAPSSDASTPAAPAPATSDEAPTHTPHHHPEHGEWHCPTHYRRAPGKALCASALPGEWLTAHRPEVTCQDCIEWIHA